MLTKQQLTDIERLQKECESNDHVQLKLNWEMLRNRESDRLDYFQYENDRLVAFLGLYPFGSTVEVCGMAEPGERRKGHFRRLFLKAMAIVRQDGYMKILLNAPAGSASAKAFLREQGAEYAFSEHQMEWQRRPVEEAVGIRLREATAADFELRVRLNVTAFGLDEEDSLAMERRLDGERDTAMYMIEAHGVTVGKIRVSREAEQAWIYGFSILPEHQGRGIGRNVLRQVIQDQSAAGYSIRLEVETKNDHALGLYESVGFKVVHAQDYYRYSNERSQLGW
ncbi:GNAT family N-acetyltransferase [Cohnella suwonensis]|uniref:GNAT family N-acetyltransferase n=1 Tax=Cohnella suwonensis TaxID=696072 RepID=A0ABW0M1K0_9BACL